MDSIKSSFDRYFVNLDTLGDHWGHRWRGTQRLRHGYCLRQIVQAVPRNQVNTLIDVGCAAGDFTDVVNRAYEPRKVIVTDTSSLAIRFVEEQYPSFDAKQCALPEVPALEDKADLVLAMEVLCYLSKVEAGDSLRSLSEAMRDGAWLACSNKENCGSQYLSTPELREEIQQHFEIVATATIFHRWYAETIEKWLLSRYQAYRARRTAAAKGKRLRFHTVRLPILSFQEKGAFFFLTLQFPIVLFSRLTSALHRRSAASHTVFIARKKSVEGLADVTA